MSKAPVGRSETWLRELGLRAVVLIGRALIMLVGRSVRFRETGADGVFDKVFKRNERVIFAFWHNRLFFFIYYMAWRFIWHGRPLSIIISASRDGEFAARVGLGFGADIVRGSSSRMAVSGLVGLLRRGLDDRAESCPVFTPDGPRGPKYHIQPGVIFLAQKTGLPIVPVTYGVNRGMRLRSWDNFLIPTPFSRALVRYGPAIEVPPDADDTTREALRARLQAEMIALTKETERAAGFEDPNGGRRRR
ncbi:MAG: lysophospholipid acyltransferase family protein [Planctomycetota bacterium]|nr:lysophospholipid acyltransferase family protein [Planctomycetota bacterium]